MDSEAYTRWIVEGQPYELECWRNEQAMAGRLNKDHAWEFQVMSVNPEEWNGRVVLDVGAGPQSCWEHCSVDLRIIEPLASSFNDFNTAKYAGAKVYAVPAETTIPELFGQCDCVWSFNALDHCFDWRAVLGNIVAYLKPGGHLILSTDCERPPTIGHPGIESADVLLAVLGETGLEIERFVKIPVVEAVHERVLSVWATKKETPHE